MYVLNNGSKRSDYTGKKKQEKGTKVSFVGEKMRTKHGGDILKARPIIKEIFQGWIMRLNQDYEHNQFKSVP